MHGRPFKYTFEEQLILVGIGFQQNSPRFFVLRGDCGIVNE
jgi:hypothetical protein